MATVTDSVNLADPEEGPHSTIVGDGAVRLLTGAFAYLTSLAVIGWMFWSTFSALPAKWDQDPNYSHGYMIPVAFLLFAIRIGRQTGFPILPSVSRSEFIAAAIRIVAGTVIHLCSVTVGAVLFDVIAMILVAGGVVMAIGGRYHYRRFAFPLWFLIFMAPLPKVWYDTIAINMQQIASAVSATIFEACGIPVFREGCYIRIPNFQMEVGAACSGLRQLAAIVALSLAVGHLSDRSRTYKWALGLLSIPIAIGANCIRVTSTGFILMWFGQEWAEGIYHTLEGLAIVAVAAVLILIAAWWLSGFKFSRTGKEPATLPGKAAAERVSHARVVRRPLLWMSVVVAISAGANLFIDRRIAAIEKPQPVALRKPLEQLPMRIGDWKGEDRPISEEAAYGDEHLNRDYVNQRTGQRLRLWAIYSSRGLDRDHHPEVCMSVAGQKENRSARTTFDVPGHSTPVLQYQFHGVSGSQWVCYWYYVLAEDSSDPVDEYQRLYRRMHYKPSSVTFQVYLPARSKSSAEGAREFVRLVDALIQQHVGKTAVRGNRRKQVTVNRGSGGE